MLERSWVPVARMNRQLFGLLEIAASVAVFVSALLFVRWRYQLDRRLAGE